MSDLTIKYITPKYFYELVKLLKTIKYSVEITDNSLSIRFDTQRDLCVELFDVWQLLKEFEYSSVPIDLEDFLKTYTRFNVVSSPTLRVKSGSTGNFSVGADVPVISDFTERNGKIIQSVQYRQSGVIFNIEPVVKINAIDLKINQQLSNFIKTDKGT